MINKKLEECDEADNDVYILHVKRIIVKDLYMVSKVM
jgi:hypothetical protein